MARGPRIRRKDLKKPDQFVTTSGRFVTWVRANTGVAIAVGGGVVVLIAVAGIVTAFQSARRHDANGDLARAMATLRADNLDAAAGELDEVSRRWGGTSLADLAAVLAANTALRMGNVDTAITDVQSLGSAGDLPPYLRQQLLLVWGYALTRKEQWGEAAAKFAEAESLTGPYSAQAVLGQARAMEAAGDAEAARELYKKLYEQFPDAPGRDQVESKIEVVAGDAAASS